MPNWMQIVDKAAEIAKKLPKQQQEQNIEPQRPVDIFADSPGSTANRIRERRKKMQEELDKINK